MHVRIEDLSLSPPSGYGYRPLLERLGARANVPVDSVVHAQGTSMANHLAMAALLEPGDEVLLEEPGYEAIFAAAQYLGAKIRRFPRKIETGFQVDPREIERAISPRTRMIAITNLHNPSGVRTPDSALKMVGQIARSVGAHVLVDEVYLEMCFDSPWQSAFHLGPNFVVTSSLTKAYGLTALRCGWVFAAPALAERMWRLNDLFGSNSPYPVGSIERDGPGSVAANRGTLEEAARYEPRAFEGFPRFANVTSSQSGPRPARLCFRNSRRDTRTPFASC